MFLCRNIVCCGVLVRKENDEDAEVTDGKSQGKEIDVMADGMWRGRKYENQKTRKS